MQTSIKNSYSENSFLNSRYFRKNVSCRQTCIAFRRHAAKLGHTLIKQFATYPRQQRKSTLPVVSIAVGMRSKNKNTVMLKYCGIKTIPRISATRAHP